MTISFQTCFRSLKKRVPSLTWTRVMVKEADQCPSSWLIYASRHRFLLGLLLSADSAFTLTWWLVRPSHGPAVAFTLLCCGPPVNAPRLSLVISSLLLLLVCYMASPSSKCASGCDMQPSWSLKPREPDSTI